jgi:putative methionine-R-sulfoxide reductase with GAF domain
MELSILNLHDPAPARPIEERRHRIRHKLHSPVYASFNGQSTGMVLELSELLDLSEDGFAVQTGHQLPVSQSITLSLDLPETKAHIHGAGQVVWSDGAGRGGIRFSGLTEQSQRVLKEWLFVNLLLACQKSAARTAPVSLPVEKETPAVGPILQDATAAPISDPSGILSAVEAVRGEVRVASDFDAALRLITERALSLTGASGAALAFLTDDKMICRASSGEPALPLGTAVDVKQGLTGECIRGGRIVSCADVETDACVDREICRLLGIGSIMAAPIVADFRVVGLIEVFSPHARAFTEVHQTALDRLVELVPKAQPAVLPAQEAPVEVRKQRLEEPAPTLHTVREAVWEPEREAQEPLKGVPVRLANIVLLVLTVAAVALVSGYLLAPRIEKTWLSKTAQANNQPKAAVAPSPVTQATTLDDLRKRAELGDAYAQWMLGTRFHNGEGVPQDDAQAMRWFVRAAEQGYIDAQATSGAYYWAGRGVHKDLSKAYFWSTVALNQGDSSMESRLQGLALQMTPAQMAAAQSQADDWLRQHRAAK